MANQLLDDDLARYDQRLSRHSVSLGKRADKSGEEVRISPSRNSILVAGPSASGKSTAVSGIVEQLAKQGYQFCLIDPEGDYEGFARALSFGTFHLRRGDYSNWFKNLIKDADLAQETASVEANRELSAADSRARIRQAIEQRYTAPS
ncbi:MAG TPA: DUF87 domain-containing protein [Terriglobales bacterium]|nr:DUF87 domain-containing protein [Terriglobales bacterium]